jgi:hypothetical protein
MDTVANERVHDEFVKKLLLIMQGHFDEASIIILPQDNTTDKTVNSLVKYKILVRQNGREAIIDTVTREVEVKEEMMIDTEEGYS